MVSVAAVLAEITLMAVIIFENVRDLLVATACSFQFQAGAVLVTRFLPAWRGAKQNPFVRRCRKGIQERPTNHLKLARRLSQVLVGTQAKTFSGRYCRTADRKSSTAQRPLKHFAGDAALNPKPSKLLNVISKRKFHKFHILEALNSVFNLSARSVISFALPAILQLTSNWCTLTVQNARTA